MRTHYDNLHITETAGLEVIKAAYKALAQKWHPDKNHGQREKAERAFKIITRAYEVLSDPELRRKYDDWLIAQRGAEPDEPEPEAVSEPSAKNQRDSGFKTGQKGPEQAKHSGVTAAKAPLLGRLWRGEEGLGRTFWLYGVIGLLIVSFASFFWFAVIAEDKNDIARIVRSAQNFYVGYFIFISICTFRSFRRSLLAPCDSPDAGEPRGAAPRATIMQKFMNGDLQARYVIAFGSVIPTIALSIFYRVAFEEKADYEVVKVRVYAFCALYLLTAAYVIWSAQKLDSGPRKRAIIGASLLWGFFVLIIAATF